MAWRFTNVHTGKTSAWDTCAPAAAVLAAGGRMTDYFGAPLSYTGAVGNTLGVIASSARASKAHDAACATLRRDARALAVLERYGVRGDSHAADIARELTGEPLAVATVAEAAGVAAASYHAPEGEAFRGALSAGCRLRLADTSVFLKRVKMRELPAAVKKATAQPQTKKTAPDVDCGADQSASEYAQSGAPVAL